MDVGKAVLAEPRLAVRHSLLNVRGTRVLFFVSRTSFTERTHEDLQFSCLPYYLLIKPRSLHSDIALVKEVKCCTVQA